MNQPRVGVTAKPDNPAELLIVTIEDGTNKTIFEADEAAGIYQELGEVLRSFGLIEPTEDNHAQRN